MADPLLTYSLGTEPFPLQASAATGPLSPATLTVVAANATGAPVALQAVSITLPTGWGKTDLTPEPTAIAPVPPPGWKPPLVSSPAGAVTFTFLPDGAGTVPASASLSFTFNQVQVNREAGHTQVTVMEGSGGCSPPACPSRPLPLTKFPSGWGTVSFWATPLVVPQGGGPTLGWAGPGGATYHIEYYTPQTGVVVVPAAGDPPFASRGEYPPAGHPLSLRQTTTFTLLVADTVDGQAYAAQRQSTVTVEVPAPVITSFHGTLGGPADAPSLTLEWATQDAVRCGISTVSVQFEPHGSWPLEWPLEKSYTLTAWNSANVATTATWHVPPVIARFGGEPRVTGAGATVRVAVELSWAVLLADRCTLSGVSGTVPGSGSTTFEPSAAAPLATTHTLTAVNGPQTTTATVHVTWGVGAGHVRPVAGGYWALAVTPDGRSMLLSSDARGSSPTVVRLDAATLAVTGTSPALDSLPLSLAVAPDGSRVFAALNDGFLGVLDATTLALLPTPRTGFPTNWIAVTPDGRRLLASVTGGIAVLDPATLEPLRANVPLSPQPQGLAVSRDGTRVYVACANTPEDGSGVVAVLDAETLAPVAGPVKLPGAQTVSIAPDGQIVFAGYDAADDTEAYLAVIDAVTLQVAPARVSLRSQVNASAAAVDGSRVFGCSDSITVMVPSAVTRTD
ncbi:MAG TPA: YncE family protein [Longimicrobium sp.]|jgi:DNA-binding beta-propeller fold protein YncE